MGQSQGIPEEPVEVISARLHRAKILKEQKTRKKSIQKSIVKKALYSTSDSQTDIPALPNAALLQILEYLAPQVQQLMAVSSTWYMKILEVFSFAFTSVESQFALLHSNLFELVNSYISASKIEVSKKKGQRMDRVIVAEPLKILAGHTIKIRYTYKTFSNPNTYKAEFKLDCIPKKSRTVWVHKDECRLNSEETRKAYSQQIPKVCIGDHIEIAVNWLNLLGTVRLDSIKWQPPLIQDTRAILKSVQLAPEFPVPKTPQNEGLKKKLYLYNVSRHCEVELSQTEWYDTRYYPLENYQNFRQHLMPYLKLIRSEFSGSDILFLRNTYKATREGMVPDSGTKLGVQVEIKTKNKPLTHEVKRMGLLYDRERPIQVRLDDLLVLYLSLPR